MTRPAPFSAAAPILLTDGTVMVQDTSTENWWRLTPDNMGGYAEGTWSRMGAMPAGYSPLYYASGVLPDGRVIVMGGEYLAGNLTWTTRGAIYDPLTDRWSEVNPPAGWTTIGDASGAVLANGAFLLSDCCSAKTAIFDPRSFAWTPTGTGKADLNDEESWTTLPDDSILTIDCNNLLALTQAERYVPSIGRWISAGLTPVQITDTNADVNNPGSHEIGPAALRPDGTVLAIGGNGHNVIFDTATMTWSVAPDLPIIAEGQLDIADGSAATLPNGNVLLAASPGVFNVPTRFYEWDGISFTDVGKTPNADLNTSYQQFMVLLPTGEVLMTDFSQDVELYTPAAGVAEAAVPVITHVPELVTTAQLTSNATLPPSLDATSSADLPVATLFVGSSYKLRGTRLNGVTQGAYYGDDLQSSSNYPIVRLTNDATGHVAYLRTHGHSSRAIGHETRSSTLFDVPATAERGLGTIATIANGVSSPPIAINIK